MARKSSFCRGVAAAVIGVGLGLSGGVSASPAQSPAQPGSASARTAYFLNYHAYAWAGDYSAPVLQYYSRCGVPSSCQRAGKDAARQPGLHIAELMNLGRSRHVAAPRADACPACPGASGGKHSIR